MEKLFEKLKEYLHMDDEIPFEEFSEYYHSVMDELNANFQQMEQDDLVKARFICSIVQSNSDSRSKRSKSKAKVFKKMTSKCAFWADAINFNLLKSGLSQAQIDQATEEINQAV